MPYVSTMESRVRKQDKTDPIKVGCIGAVYAVISGGAVYWAYDTIFASAIPPKVLRSFLLIPFDISDTAIRIGTLVVMWLLLHTLILVFTGIIYRTRTLEERVRDLTKA